MYETKSLYDHCASNHGDGWQAKKRAETFINGALDRWGYTVNFVDTTDYIPAPPTERCCKEFYDECVLCDTHTNTKTLMRHTHTNPNHIHAHTLITHTQTQSQTLIKHIHTHTETLMTHTHTP